MEVDERLAALPRAYALALRLEAAGVDTALIADCLGVEPEGVGPLLRMAHEKLDALSLPGKEEKS